MGNFNAFIAAYPEKDWVVFSKSFVTSLGLNPKILTTQILPKEEIADFFNLVVTLNNVLLDLNQDMWLYISYDYFTLKTAKGEVGSSTMPHKINPIAFENSEGNIILANTLLQAISGKIQVSRLQRDLSDSTITRNYGVALAHSLLAYKNTLRGLEKIQPNIRKINQDLADNPAIITEGIQTILRREGTPGAYEKLKELTRGKSVTQKRLRSFIRSLKLPKRLQAELLALTVKSYTGLSSKLAIRR